MLANPISLYSQEISNKQEEVQTSSPAKEDTESLFSDVSSNIVLPYFGLWFGVVSPVPGTKITDIISGFLGGGLYFRLYLPLRFLQFETGLSYAHYRSKNTTTLHLLPFYASFIYTLPFNSVLKFNLKLGFGGVWGYLLPDERDNVLPGLFAGMEFHFPAGKFFKIGLRLDYMFIFDRHLPAPPNVTSYERVDGHMIHFGVTALFTWIKE